jgi:hypothetical protein
VRRRTILFDDGLIGIRALDRMVQAMVFFADTVAIRASYDIPNSDRHQAVILNRRLRELRDQGLVVFWAHEYEVNSAGLIEAKYAPAGESRPVDLVVERDNFRSRLGEMNEILRNTREEAYLRHPALPGRQGIAEVVDLRSQLTSLLVSAELGSHGLLADAAAGRLLARRQPSVEGPTFQQEVAREVVGQLQLGGLGSLTFGQIQTIRNFGDGFRRLLDESLIAVSRGMDPVITPRAAATHILHQYDEIRARYGLGSGRGEITSEVVWDVAGMALPPTVLLKYAMKIFAWRRSVNELRPFLMLLHLERNARRGADPHGG